VASLNSDQAKEVTFISGVTSQGTIAGQSFWTWNRDQPATYSTTLSYEAKWGPSVAGAGGTVTIGFDAASNWTTTEQSAFLAAMHLWSAEANINFSVVSPFSAEVVISRDSDGKAQGGINTLDTGDIGGTRLGIAESGSISIDTSKGGFGPIGASFGTAGGYPWSTILHELGHVIGLGHAGAYDSGAGSGSPMYTSYDTTAYSLMSYNDAPDVSGSFIWGSSGGYARAPVTPMMLDIAAAERIYGMPANTPLSGGQIFGFHTNITGDIAQFFDFTINTRPVITLFDTGVGNTLDLSGYTIGSTVNLHEGAFSSVSGLQNNLAIAFGTRIDTAIGGIGSDAVTANDNGDVLMGAAGSDTLNGGAGNDHIYGNLLSSTQGTTDGADVIDTGGGSNYVNGNAGNDTITASTGSNRLYGGQGDDTIRVTGNGNNHLNGNLGDDTLIVDAGNNDVHGGQGNDTIQAGGGSDTVMGDLGDDWIDGGRGLDTMYGGAGSDVFAITEFDATYVTHPGWRWYYQIDEIADFEDGVDHLHIDAGIPLVLTQLGHQASVQAASELATPMFLNSQTNIDDGFRDVAVAQVGHDAVLFFWGAAIGMEATRIDNLDATHLTATDFV